MRERWGDRRIWLGLIIAVGLALRLPGLDPDLADYNSWRQIDTATIARNFLEEPRILWPRVDWGAPGPGYVEAEFQLLPFVTSLIYRLLGENPNYGRLLSLLATGLAGVVLDRISRRYFSGGLALVCTATFLMTPIVFRFSRAFMPDAVALLFMLIALERFLAFVDDDKGSTAIQSAVSLSLAILVKPVTAHIGLVLVSLAVLHWGWRGLVQPVLLAYAAVAVIPPVAYYLHAASIYLDYGNTFGVLVGGDSKWGTLAWRLDPSFYWNLVYVETVWVFGPVGVLLAGVGVARFKNREWDRVVTSWLLATAVYYFVVARYAGEPRLGLHYHLFAAPLAALLLAGGLAALQGERARWGAFLLMLAIGVFGYQAFCAVKILRLRETALFIDAGRAVATVSEPDDLVVVVSDAPAHEEGIANNFEQPNLFFFARRRGRVLARDHQTREGLESAITPEFQWFVNFPSLNDAADPSFHEYVNQRMTMVEEGEDFQIFSIDQP